MMTPEWLTELHNDCAKADRHGDAVEWSTDSVRALLDLIEQLGTALEETHGKLRAHGHMSACCQAIEAFRAGPDGRTTT